MILLYTNYDNHIGVLMGVYITESVLRAVVCSKFSAKALEVFIADESLSRKFNLAYYIVMGLLLFTLIFMSYFSGSYSLNCEVSMFTIHWFILAGIDIIQSILITASSFYIIRQMQIMNHKVEGDASNL